MKQQTFIILVSMLLPAVAAANDSGKYQCNYGDLQRRIEIAHEPGVEVPCSVHYFKDTETGGEQQVLWSADSDPTYCKSKTLELVAKLEGWGWDCGQNSDSGDHEEVIEEPPVAEPEEMLGDPKASVEADSDQ